jgi:ureidoacrylate peracid hydrolase
MAMELTRDKTALIVVDMQNCFLDAKGSMAQLGFDWQRLAASKPGCQRLIQAARKADVPVIWTQYVYQADYSDGGAQIHEIMPMVKDVKLCVAGTWDADFPKDIAPQKGDIVIEKNRASSFYETRLDSYLRPMGIQNLVVCGVTTNICVETTVRDATQRNYRSFVVRDATGEVEQDRYDVSLKTMSFFFARVMNVSEVLDSWNVELSNA